MVVVVVPGDPLEQWKNLKIPALKRPLYGILVSTLTQPCHTGNSNLSAERILHKNSRRAVFRSLIRWWTNSSERKSQRRRGQCFEL